MSSLIGTKPNQVPCNGDLGSLAYMDKEVFNDRGITQVGALCMCKSAAAVAAGATVAGSTLNPSGVAGNTGNALSGTWRALGTTTTINDVTLFQKITL